jgi:guanylate kinase
MTLEKIVRAKIKKKHDTNYTKSIILCGKSGSGKDFLLETFNLKQVCTNTTRPKRPYEMDGVHKYFHQAWLIKPESIKKDPDTVAWTQRGEYFYWTDIDDFKNPADIWIIDVPGIISIAEEHKHRFKVVYLDAPLWRRIINMRLRKEPWLSILKRVWIDHKDFKALKKIPHIRITR